MWFQETVRVKIGQMSGQIVKILLSVILEGTKDDGRYRDHQMFGSGRVTCEMCGASLEFDPRSPEIKSEFDVNIDCSYTVHARLQHCNDESTIGQIGREKSDIVAHPVLNFVCSFSNNHDSDIQKDEEWLPNGPHSQRINVEPMKIGNTIIGIGIAVCIVISLEERF